MLTSKVLPGLLMAFALSVTLINSHHFIYQTLTSFFLFTLAAWLLAAYAGVQLITKSVSVTLKANYSFYSFLLWGIFIGLHALFIKGESGNLKEWLIIAYLLFYLAIFLLLSYYLELTNWLFIVLQGLVLLEALICIIQFFQGSSGFSSYFEVTGSQVNPNLTAMFIAMVSPILCTSAFNTNKKVKKLALVTIGFAILALLLLKCRTAWIGALVSSLLVLNSRFQCLTWLMNTGKKWVKLVLLPMALLFLIALSTVLYSAKKASADGRKTIWANSWQLIQEKPLIGYGYGLFDRYYNLQQANYFSQGKGSEQEKANGSYVHMAYNEFLENTVEGGLPGGLLFILVLVAPLITYLQKKVKKPEQTAAFAGIVAFLIMSMVNFTVQALPVASVWVLYAAIISVVPINAFKQQSPTFSNGSLKWTGILLFISALLFAQQQLSLLSGFLKQKKAVGFLTNGRTTEAIQLLGSLESKLSRCESYHVVYGQALLTTGNYPDAIQQFLLATQYTSQPDVFYYLGHCYEKLNQPQSAEKYYQQALNIVPSRFTPRYALMQLYVQQGQLGKALSMADTIRHLGVKVPSQEVASIQQEANTLLKNNNKL